MLKQGSTPERMVARAREVDVICLSEPVADEIRTVFSRPKLLARASPERADALFATLLEGATWFTPTTAVTDCRDPKDNKYLELALAAQAACIVSSDTDLLDLHPWRGTPVLTPAAYLDLRA